MDLSLHPKSFSFQSVSYFERVKNQLQGKFQLVCGETDEKQFDIRCIGLKLSNLFNLVHLVQFSLTWAPLIEILIDADWQELIQNVSDLPKLQTN